MKKDNHKFKRYRSSFLRTNCDKCNKPSEPLINAFGRIIINKCYLCSPHLNNGYGECGREFKINDHIVESHDRFMALCNVVVFLKENGHKQSEDTVASLAYLLDKLGQGAEEVYINRSKTSKPSEFKEVGKRPQPELVFPVKTRDKKYMRVKDRKRNTFPNSEFTGTRGANWGALEMYGKKRRKRSSLSETKLNEVVKYWEDYKSSQK